MRIITGLGNPGEKYNKTRHNIGFMAVDKIQEIHSLENFKLEKKFKSEISKGEIGGEKIMLVKPQTFMNNSGDALQSIIKFYKLGVKDAIVIHDEVDLPLGKLKISHSKSAAGHNGIKSIIEHLGSEKLIRLRLGVSPNKKLPSSKTVKYVLQNFSLFQKKELNKVLSKVPEALENLLKDGLETAMNKFN